MKQVNQFTSVNYENTILNTNYLRVHFNRKQIINHSSIDSGCSHHYTVEYYYYLIMFYIAVHTAGPTLST